MIETAKQWGAQPPSVFLGGDGDWTVQDRVLVHAHTLYQQALCPECGQPKTECSSTSYQVTTRVCRASAAVQDWRDQNKTPSPGTLVYPIPSEAEENSVTVGSAPQWWLDKYGGNPSEG